MYEDGRRSAPPAADGIGMEIIMIHIFQMERLTKAVTEYIIKRLAIVCEDINPKDAEGVAYLTILYQRVLEDQRIAPEERSLMHILDKLEEDLMYDRRITVDGKTFDKGIFGERAEFVLDFLEADLLRCALLSCNNEAEVKALGRVRWLKKTYFSEEREEKKERLTPGAIKRYVDQYVIGQEAAKKAVAVAVYRHDKMVKHPVEKFAANVVLLVGPSGCGKTEIIRRIHEITKYPVVCTDVSSLGASQYRGRHKEDLLISLWEKAGRKRSEAERGIIFMDEFDKVLQPVYSERGVNVHDDVQSQLLTMLEGSDVELKVNGRIFTMNTSHILFILAGAFQGIEECIRESKTKEEGQSGFIGFRNPLLSEIDTGFCKDNITHEVLMKYGMKRELAGRISEIAVLNPLKREDMIRILTVPKDNLIDRYAREIRLACGAELIFTEEALEKIADMALAEETGARALYQIVRRTVRKCLFESPGAKGISRITITGEVVSGEKSPVLCMENEAEDWDAGEWNEESF